MCGSDLDNYITHEVTSVLTLGNVRTVLAMKEMYRKLSEKRDLRVRTNAKCPC